MSKHFAYLFSKKISIWYAVRIEISFSYFFKKFLMLSILILLYSSVKFVYNTMGKSIKVCCLEFYFNQFL